MLLIDLIGMSARLQRACGRGTLVGLPDDTAVQRRARETGRATVRDEDIARLRLRRQRLTDTALPTPEAAVGWLGVVQAQEFGVAKWSIAQRSRGRVTSAD